MSVEPSNSGLLVQIQKLEGTIQRVKRGETPIVEVNVLPHQRVISIELTQDRSWSSTDDARKTVDWSWTAYLETRL